MAPNTHWARILDTPHEYSDTSSTHGAACNDPTMTSGGDQQLISGKLSRYFDEESRCSNMSSRSMHAADLADDVVLDCESALASVGCSRYQRTCSTCRRSSALYMAGDINFENDERRSTGTSTASLTIKRLLSLKARLFVLAGAERDTGRWVLHRPSRVGFCADVYLGQVSGAPAPCSAFCCLSGELLCGHVVGPRRGGASFYCAPRYLPPRL